MHDGDAGVVHELQKATTVDAVFAAGENDARAGNQREKQFEAGDVKGKGGDGEETVSSSEAGLLAHGAEQIDNVAVRDLDAFGFPG